MHSGIILTHLATQHCHIVKQQLVNNRRTTSSPFVLRSGNNYFLYQTEDRDRTVSQRSELSSRTTFNSEQLYPWNHLQHQDVMSQHRSTKQPRRYELRGVISLLSLEYLLSVER